nr:hypothetical protein [uncultured Prevotella sp.]
MIEIKTFAKPKKTGGSSGSSSSTKYISGVISEAEHAARADKAKRAEVADQANYAGTAASAQNAVYASEAGNLREDAEILLQYLSLKATKDPQVVKGMVNFENIIRFLGDVYMGNMSGSGEFNHSGIIRNTGDIENNGNITNIGDVLNDGDITNTGTMKTKNLEVTGAAHFFQLVIDKVKAMGGALLITPADGFDVDIVEKVSGGYKLYWRCQDEDGHQRDNMWKVNDQALCMSFNRARIGKRHVVSNKYYWSLVTEVNDSLSPIDKDGVKYHYILISDTVRVGAVQPEVSDSIVMLGHRGTDEDRKSAIYISAYKSLDMGLTAPCFAQYRGIDDFDLASHRQSYCDAKGSKFIGDFEVSSGKSVQELIDGKASKDDLKQYASKDDLKTSEASLRVDSKNIALSVSEKSIARRNLLVGSDFRKQTNDFIISNDARIEMNSGYQGTNCIKVIDDTDGTPHYIGVHWDGSQGGKSIKIEKGKKYTISCWYFTNDTNASLYLEAIYTDKQTNATRKGQATFLSPNNFLPKYKQWQLFTTVIDTTNAKSDYIAFNFWELCNINAGRIEAYICRPMVEEGDTYNGWTLSDKDYDYVGANLIDNSRTFELGGNVIRVVGTKKLVGDAYELSATLGDDYNTFYEIDNTAFKLNTDYTISFEVKGDAKYMGVFVYYKPTNTPWAYCKEQQDNPLYEANGDGKTDGYGVLLEVKDLSDKQQKVWSHFKFKERLPESIYLQFPKNQDQSGVTSWNVTITKPKIEEGAVVTEYTERKSDLVDKASLKAAGVLVDSESVTLYGNQVHIKKNKTDTNDAVLIDTNTGKVSAALIDAKKIVADGIETQDLIISGSSRSPFSQAENGKDMSYSDNVFLQGKNEWINSYALKWDATQSGRLIRLANYNWNGNATSGYGKIKTPDASHFFFMNGEKRSQLYISEQEMVELLGIGDKTSFIGWAVVNRIHLNYYLNGMNVPILIMGKVEVFKNIYGNGYIISSNVQSFRGFGDYQGNNPTEVIDATRVDTGVYHLLLQPELAKYLYNTDIVVQATGIGNSLKDGNNHSSPIKATFNGIHFGSYPKYEGSYIEICTSDDDTKDEGSFFIEVKCMDFFGSNS